MYQSRSCWARGFLLLLAIATTMPSEASLDEAAKSVVRILVTTTEKGCCITGSGAVIAENKVLTNQHVVEPEVRDPENKEPPKKLEVKKVEIAYEETPGQPSVKVPVEVEWLDSELDLALLRAKNLKLPIVPFVSRELSMREKVWAFGFPGTSDRNDDINLKVTQTSGIISQFQDSSWSGGGRPIKIIQHTAPVNPGNSGGPLFDNCGYIAGVNTQGRRGKLAGTFWALHVVEVVSKLGTEGQKILDAPNEKCGDDALSWTPWLILLSLVILLFMILVVFVLWDSKRRNISPKEHKIYTNLRKSLKKSPKVVTKRPRIASFEFTDPNEVKGRLSTIQVTEQEHAVERGGFVIGRHPALSDESIEHPTVSRRHVRFFWKRGDCFIEDMNSSAGTRLNQTQLRPFEPQLLHSRDRVAIGGISFIVNLN